MREAERRASYFVCEEACTIHAHIYMNYIFILDLENKALKMGSGIGEFVGRALEVHLNLERCPSYLCLRKRSLLCLCYVHDHSSV